MTEVMLVFYQGRIEHWLRFGTEDCERILDRRRRIISFAAGKIFAFVRWEANEYGTVLSRLDILRAQCRRNRCDRPRRNAGRRNPVARRQLATREARI
jgi:hypothetical protein